VGLLIAGPVLLIGAHWVLRGLNRPALPEVDLSGAHQRVVEAIERAQADVRSDPRSGANWGELGMVLAAHDFNRAALDCLQQARSLDEGDFRWPYLQGVIMHEVDPAQAALRYGEAVRMRPDRAPLQYRLGAALLETGDRAGAQTAFAASQQAAPQSTWPLVGLARAAVAEGRVDEALQFAETAVRIDSYSRAALLELAGICQRSGRTAEAQGWLLRAEGLPDAGRWMPDPVVEAMWSREALGVSQSRKCEQLHAQRRFDEAEAAYAALIRERPDLAGPRLGLAVLYQQSGRPQAAAEAYREVVELHPEHASAWYNLATVHVELNDHAAAAEAFQRWIDLYI
jgi:tetratricopeptide (TPR) repeat protein